GVGNDFGDGGPATAATLGAVVDVAFDEHGRVVVVAGGIVRVVDVDGTIRAVAGPLHPPGPGPLAHAGLYAPHALLSDDAAGDAVGDTGDDDILAGTAFAAGAFGRLLRVNLD